jgi:hypothetical protein
MCNIELSEIARLMRHRLGLIIGPSQTLYPGCFSDLAEAISERFQIEPGATYLETADRAVAAGVNEEEIRHAIRAFFAAQAGSSDLRHLVRAKWAAIYSAALDSGFEELLRQQISGNLSGQQLTVLSDLSAEPPPRDLLVLKLLGALTRDTFAFSTPSYITQRASWRLVVKTFADRVRSNPVLCVGMSDCPTVLFDLLGEICGARETVPSALIFLEDDPLYKNLQLQGLTAKRVQTLVIKGKLGDVVSALLTVDSAPKTVLVKGKPDVVDPVFQQFEDLATLVNHQLKSSIDSAEHLRLRDLLFSPEVPRWDPYAHDLDFKRTTGSAFATQIVDLLERRGINEGAAVLVGGVASGKTSLLKRVAFDIAGHGFPTLWLRPWFYQDTGRALHTLLPAVKKLLQHSSQPVVAVVDDPLSFGSASPRQITNAARNVGINLFVVVAVRSGEWSTFDQDDMLGGAPLLVEERLPDALDDDEWGRLPEYLVRVGIARDITEANGQIAKVDCRQARDTLSMLYFLLPQTRVQICGAIRQEYLRLGDMAGLSQVIVGAATHTTDLLKAAYEMVAVGDSFGVAVPIEVLVSALRVSYGDWIDATKSDAPAWGLLYADESATGETVCYRTRNAIVTDEVVRMLNGGGLGHSGELRVMLDLLRACTGSTPAYREFCIRALVPHDRLKRFEYLDGIRLYDAALRALPHPEKTLLHHKSLWTKNQGRDPIQASRIATQALLAPDYPYSDRGEANEYIHNSLAAMALDAVELKKMSADEGREAVLTHLAKARPPGFFNPRAVHVQANLMLELADKIPTTSSADAYELVDRALTDVDRTLDALLSPFDSSRSRAESIHMLEQVRDEIELRFRNAEQLRADADQLWETYSSQHGFVLAARQALRRAVKENKGNAFKSAFDYCKNCTSKVEKKGMTPSPLLHEVAMMIYYHWRVRRSIFKPTNDVIDWHLLHELSRSAMQCGDAEDQPYSKYINALALAHRGEWGEANTIFAQLRQSRMRRDLVWLPRDYLQNPLGGIRWVQGEIRAAAARMTLWVEDLGTDFYLSKEGNWPRAGAIEHAAIQFSFGSVTAVDRI